jgi:acyl-CoA reductase-like NAD-dependent aldehyde dehydrogenase
MERVTGPVKDAVDKGATTLSGGHADGACSPPTVITGVTPATRPFQRP